MLPLFRTAKYLFLAYAVALAGLWFVLFVASYETDDAAALLLLPLMFAWQIGAAAMAAVCVRLSHTPDGGLWFLGMEALIVGSAAWFWYDLNFVHVHSMNGIALGIFLPFWQYVAFTVAWLIALAAGWRPSRKWPDGGGR